MTSWAQAFAANSSQPSNDRKVFKAHRGKRTSSARGAGSRSGAARGDPATAESKPAYTADVKTRFTVWTPKLGPSHVMPFVGVAWHCQRRAWKDVDTMKTYHAMVDVEDRRLGTYVFAEDIAGVFDTATIGTELDTSETTRVVERG